MSCLYILDINPYQSYYLQVLSPNHLVTFLFCWWFPLLWKSLKQATFVYFCFYFYCLGDRFKNTAEIYAKQCSAYVLFQIWIQVLHLIHFELLCIYSVRECPTFIILQVAIQFFQHHLLKDSISSIVYSCSPCHRLIDNKYVGLFLGSLFCSTGSSVCFNVSTIQFWRMILLTLLFFLNVVSSTQKLHGCIQILGLFVLVLWKLS